MKMVDLLHPTSTPTPPVDSSDLRRAIAFAFATGVSGGLFAEALEKRKLAPSIGVPASFVNDLFVPDFVAHCMKAQRDDEPLVSAQHLVNLLGEKEVEWGAVV